MPEKKLGRPTDNPKSNPIHVRLDKESLFILDKYCEKKCVTRAEGIRNGIKMLEDKIEK